MKFLRVFLLVLALSAAGARADVFDPYLNLIPRAAGDGYDYDWAASPSDPDVWPGNAPRDYWQMMLLGAGGALVVYFSGWGFRGVVKAVRIPGDAGMV